MSDKPDIYFDHAATTPVDPRVVEAMLPFFSEKFGNPSSYMHSKGVAANQALDAARASVANLIGAAYAVSSRPTLSAAST